MKAIIVGIKLALRSIQRNVLRAVLTVLGILIGVAAVVTITALGAGARDLVGGRIQALGSNFILVFPQSSQVSGAKGAQGSGHRLSDDDGRAIEREASSVKLVAPMLGGAGQVVFGDRNWATGITGTTTGILEIGNWEIARGEMWNEHDEATKAKVVVLGATVAKKLFGTSDAVGQTVRIGRYPHTVLGVFKEKGQFPFGGDQDDVVMMPIGSLRARILKTPPGFAGILLVEARSQETTDRAVSQVESILRQRHGFTDLERPPDFEIHTQKEFQEKQGFMSGILTTLLVVIAGISLIVGGIGVMNIMLVSVTERTREIGIRMAIGAREGDILMQFLVEAVVLALLGGITGASLAAGAVSLVAKLSGWPMSVDPRALVISLLVSAATGISFGFFPARRAAKLDPILALHHE
ncbi:MAG TPA: ABC transporter permease [Polyangiaceae bacterium]|jgi:putative ABC transport system permease protein